MARLTGRLKSVPGKYPWPSPLCLGVPPRTIWAMLMVDLVQPHLAEFGVLGRAHLQTVLKLPKINGSIELREQKPRCHLQPSKFIPGPGLQKLNSEPKGGAGSWGRSANLTSLAMLMALLHLLFSTTTVTTSSIRATKATISTGSTTAASATILLLLLLLLPLLLYN